MLNSFEFTDANDMHEGMCDRLMFGDNGELWGPSYDWIYGTEVGLTNVALACKSFAWQFDLKRLWLPSTRWTMMVRQYLDPVATDDWLNKIDDRLDRKGRGIAVLRTNLVQGRGTGKGVRRRWGSCMLSVSYRSTPRPTLALHSRTSYFGYLAAMDITVAHSLAKEIAAINGIQPEEMEFVWTLDLAQFHGFRSLAWPLGDPNIKEQMDRDIPSRTDFPIRSGSAGYRKALDGYYRLVKSDNEGKLYGDEAFSSFARVRRRFHAEVMGDEYSSQFIGGSLNRGGHKPFPPLPSVKSENLDLTPMWKMLPEES
jgi:hypothetical protein